MDAYERAVEAAGARGRFQSRYSALYNTALVACATMAYVNVLMVLTVPPHTCRLPEPPPGVSEMQWKLKNIPLEYDAKGREIFSSCRIYTNGTNNETTECAAHEYDRTWYRSTAATTYGWVCNRELLVADVLAYSRLGEVVGSTALGWLGDTYGRKAAYITSLALMISGRTITAFSSDSFLLFVCGCVIAALPSLMATQSTMVIAMETTTSEHRAQVVMIQNLGWAAGVTLMPLFYWWLRDWLSFLLVTSGTLVPFFLLSWQHLESPRWLWTKGRPKACMQRLRYIARVNGRQLKPAVERELMETPPAVESSMGPLAVFSSCTLALNTLFVLTLWFCVMTCYAVLMMSWGVADDADAAEGNPFLRAAWQGLAEVPGYLSGAWLAERAGRRLTACSMLAATAVLSTLSALSTAGWSHSWLLNISLLMGSKLCLTASYCVLSLMATEIYPTCLRQTGLSLGTVVTAAAYALAPYILIVVPRVDVRLPGLVLAALSVVMLIAASLLPETLHAALG